MATNYIKDGSNINYTNQGAAIASGSVVVIGSLVAVALTNIDNGQTGAVSLDGIFSLPKVPANNFAQGGQIFYDVSVSQFSNATPAAGDILNAGVAVASAAGSTQFAEIKLNGNGGNISV